jgi:uncharacterized membrane protein YidH (DUF202 family)
LQRFLKVALVFEISGVIWLSILMGNFFYRAYDTSSNEHLPVSFLAALVILVLGIQQTAMSFRREKLRAASSFPGQQDSSLRMRVAHTTLIVLLLVAFCVLALILQHRLR